MVSPEQLKEFKEWLYAKSVQAYEIYVRAESPSHEEDESYAKSLAFEEALQWLDKHVK